MCNQLPDPGVELPGVVADNELHSAELAWLLVPQRHLAATRHASRSLSGFTHFGVRRESFISESLKVRNLSFICAKQQR